MWPPGPSSSTAAAQAARAPQWWGLAPVSFFFPASAFYALALGGGRSSMAAPLGFLVTTTKAVRPAVAAVSTRLSRNLRVPVPFKGPLFRSPGSGRSWLGAAASRSGPPAWVLPRVVSGRSRGPRRRVLGSPLWSDPGAPLLGPALGFWPTLGTPAPWRPRVVRSLAPAAALGPLFGAVPATSSVAWRAALPPPFFSGPFLSWVGPPRG